MERCRLGLDETRQSLTPKGLATEAMKIAVSTDSAISPLGIQLKEILQEEKAICIKMITVALLKIALNRELPSFPAIGVVNYRTSTRWNIMHPLKLACEGYVETWKQH